MDVAIIKYNAGNICSVDYALKRLGVAPIITADPAILRKADKVIFPGVGEALTTMEYLRAHRLDEVIQTLKQPVLGICLGMQLLCQHSEEGDTDCLGIFPADVKRFQPNRHEDKVPHMGWNTLSHVNSDLFKGDLEGKFVYFVHSYAAPMSTHTIASCTYGESFTAIVQQGNVYGAQFHPERSARIGALLLRNFLKV